MNITIGVRSTTVLFITLVGLRWSVVQAGQSAPTVAPLWEVTLAANGNHNDSGWKIASPQAEIKYQWSERIELTTKVSWDVLRPADGPAANGLGAGEIGFKWLFWPTGSADFSMALCPQVKSFITRSSIRRGIVSANKEFSLPVETKFRAAGMKFELKTGRNFIEEEWGEWEAELRAERTCGKNVDCILTLQRNFSQMAPSRVLVKPGLDWRLNENLTWQTAVGREVGPGDADRRELVISLGMKIVY